MRRSRSLITYTAFALALAIGSGTAVADRYNSPSRFGIGLELGAPTGLSGKYFLGGMMAVQGGVGVMETWGYDGWQVHAEAVWHPAYHRGRSVDIPFHLGVGGRVLQHHHYRDFDERCWDGRFYVDCGSDTHLGVRAPIGVSFVFKRVPMDLFIELAMVIDLVHVDNDYMYPHDHAGLDGALGGRFYF